MTAKGDRIIREKGNLRPGEWIEIRNETGRSLPVLSAVPSSKVVKKGDLLVELDGSHHKERLDAETLEWQRARAAKIQAQAKYDNQITQNVTNLAEAKLKVQLTELELEMFRDEDNGTHKLAIQEIERQKLARNYRDLPDGKAIESANELSLGLFLTQPPTEEMTGNEAVKTLEAYWKKAAKTFPANRAKNVPIATMGTDMTSPPRND